MALLQVTDVPEDVYERLARSARDENISIAQETVVLLRQALDQKEERRARRKQILQSINDLALKDTDIFPDPVEIIREDRLR